MLLPTRPSGPSRLGRRLRRRWNGLLACSAIPIPIPTPTSRPGCARRIVREKVWAARLPCCLRGLFADWGVILLDPADKDFHNLAKPLFRAAIERASELDEALLARGKAIEAAGYHQQVKVTSATTLLFEVKNGARTVVRRRKIMARKAVSLRWARSGFRLQD